MKTGFKNITIASMLAISLAGCSTSGISSHGNSIDHTGSVSRHSDDRGDRRFPKSDHVSLKGDKSKQFLSAGQEHFTNQNYGLAEKNFRKAVEVRSDNAIRMDGAGSFTGPTGAL